MDPTVQYHTPPLEGTVITYPFTHAGKNEHQHAGCLHSSCLPAVAVVIFTSKRLLMV